MQRKKSPHASALSGLYSPAIVTSDLRACGSSPPVCSCTSTEHCSSTASTVSLQARAGTMKEGRLPYLDALIRPSGTWLQGYLARSDTAHSRRRRSASQRFSSDSETRQGRGGNMTPPMQLRMRGIGLCAFTSIRGNQTGQSWKTRAQVGNRWQEEDGVNGQPSSSLLVLQQAVIMVQA